MKRLDHLTPPPSPTTTNLVTVYWRPGCPFCTRLRSNLHRSGVEIREINIWEDAGGAAFVRSVAGGNETVPTVVVGTVTLVNPSARRVLELVGPATPIGQSQRRRSILGRSRVAKRLPRAEHVLQDSDTASVFDLTDATFFDAPDGLATIVDFWAPWCGPCQTLHPLFENAARLHGREGVRFARVNVDDNPRVTAHFGIMSIPTVIVLDRRGREVDRVAGIPDRVRIEQLVNLAESCTSGEAGSETSSGCVA